MEEKKVIEKRALAEVRQIIDDLIDKVYNEMLWKMEENKITAREVQFTLGKLDGLEEAVVCLNKEEAKHD